MWNEICRSPQGGVNSFTWPKLTSAIEKVKYLDGGFLTLVFTFFKLFFIHVLWIRNFVVCLHHRNEAIPKHHDYEKAIHHIRKHWIFSCSTGDVLHRFICNAIRLQIVVDSFRVRRITKREQSRTTPVIVIQQ